MKLRDLGEFPFLRRLRERLPADPRVLLGVGDDCAAVALPGTTVLTTDAMIEGVHFRREWTTLTMLGAKAFAINASDILAMGGEPTFALLSLGVPQDTEVEDLDAFFEGFLRAASDCGTALIGGNMSAAPCLMISVTLLGQLLHGVIARAGAKVGDDVYVTGTLGDAALGLRMLQEGRTDPSAEYVKERFLCPTVRFAVSRALAAWHLAHAMIDVSDGLLQDLGHLCEAGHVGAVIDAPALPLSPAYQTMLGKNHWDTALTGGEDYELLFTAAQAQREPIGQLSQTSHCPITRLGHIVSRPEGLTVRGSDGAPLTLARSGFDHFRQGRK
ncbi:MAG: thiamine-phosphate kinase [Deltaproteobacteria bacterium]|nr:thiamine-phosphate kinase [Deltaproteobacteria bacterium]